MSIYVVGDIQGCVSELEALLELIEFDLEVDHLWALGDLINRGPNNLDTLRLLRRIPNFRTVLGNHDLHFLAVVYSDRKLSKKDTLHDLFDHSERDEIVDWLRQQPLAIYDQQHDLFLSHAGIPPSWSVTQALSRATEVELAIREADPTPYFSGMYGNTPDQFSEGLSGIDRLRCITNCLTRLRYCDSNDRLELTHKAEVAPPGYSPWFQFPRHDSTTFLFGHWAAIDGKTDSDQFVALDTGCVWGRSLTALRVEDFKRFSVPAVSSS